MRKYNYSDNFDLLTIRHEYLKNIDHVEEIYIKKFDKIVKITASMMYNKLRPNFDKVGFDYNDVVSISLIYLVGYLSNYGFKYHQSSLDKFVTKFSKTHDRLPNDYEISKAERNEVINFIRQKLQHCADTCARKARNITVGRDVVRHYAKTSASRDVHEDLILEDCKGNGYRKVTAKELKEASKKAKDDKSKVIYDKNGFEIFTIQKLNQGLDVRDYLQIVEGYDTIFMSNPESYLIKLEDQAQDEEFSKKFNGLRQSDKINVLQNFINKNKKDSSLKEEIVKARKMLKKHSFWYG